MNGRCRNRPCLAVVRDETNGMKRIVLLLVCGVLAASAQEVRIGRPAVLKSDRAIVSLRAGTMVDILSRDEWTLTVRYNNLTGTIPATSLNPLNKTVSAPAPTAGVAPVKRSGSRYVNAVNKAKENAAILNQNSTKQVDQVLASN